MSGMNSLGGAIDGYSLVAEFGAKYWIEHWPDDVAKHRF
jgi:hypothetical protein